MTPPLPMRLEAKIEELLNAFFVRCGRTGLFAPEDTEVVQARELVRESMTVGWDAALARGRRKKGD